MTTKSNKRRYTCDVLVAFIPRDVHFGAQTLPLYNEGRDVEFCISFRLWLSLDYVMSCLDALLLSIVLLNSVYGLRSDCPSPLKSLFLIAQNCSTGTIPIISRGFLGACCCSREKMSHPTLT